jgi:uncharacterized protein YceK
VKISLIFLVLAVALTGCSATLSVEEARTAYFATVDGSDADCHDWLEWCIDEGYPQADCEQRNEYCVDGEWIRGDGTDSDDPCSPAADAAYNDCIEAGGTAEDCRGAAEVAYDDCAGE